MNARFVRCIISLSCLLTCTLLAQAAPPNAEEFLEKLGKRFGRNILGTGPSEPTAPTASTVLNTSNLTPLTLGWAAEIAGESLSHANVTEFYVDGPEFYPVRRAMIHNATRTIDLITYLWCDDEAGLTIARDLADAANRGVRVRLMIDYLNVTKPHDQVYAILARAGIVPMEYNPLRWGLFLLNEHAMHEKIMIVDGQSFLTGGANLCNEYMIGGERGLWHDLELKISGPLAQKLQADYDATWNWVAQRDLDAENIAAERTASTVGFPFSRPNHKQYAEPTPSVPGAHRNTGIDVVPFYQRSYIHPQDGLRHLDFFKALIRSAKKSIVVYAPYYILEPEFERELFRVASEAVERKVRVTIFTNSPTTNDEANSRAIATARQGAALHRGLEVWEFQKRTLHAKAILIDDQLLSVGSHNFTWRSFAKNGDLNVMLSDPKIIARFQEMVASDQDPARGETLRLDIPTWESRFDEFGEQFMILVTGYLKGLI